MKPCQDSYYFRIVMMKIDYTVTQVLGWLLGIGFSLTFSMENGPLKANMTFVFFPKNSDKGDNSIFGNSRISPNRFSENLENWRRKSTKISAFHHIIMGKQAVIPKVYIRF